MDRTTLVTGPAKCTFNGATFFSKTDIEPRFDQTTLNIEDSAHGITDQRVIEAMPEVSLTPDGRWSPALIAALWPHANARLGASILTSSDLPLVMSGSDGEIHTIPAAGVFKMPNILLSATKTLVGSATFRGCRTKGSIWSTNNSLYVVTGSGGTIDDATYDPLDIPVQGYVANWGAVAGFTAMDTVDGWTIEFDMQVEPIGTDSIGALDYRFKSLSVMARGIPTTPTSTQSLAAALIQGTGARRGRSLSQDGSGNPRSDLVITGEDGIDYCTIKAAGIKQAGFRFGATVLRQGEIGFVAARTYSAGVQQPLFVLAAS
jgi:hypothetical protein